MSKPDRKSTLLRAAYDLIRRSQQGPFVEDTVGIVVHYDDCDCDGYCLADDIAAELGIEETAEPIPLEESDDVH